MIRYLELIKLHSVCKLGADSFLLLPALFCVNQTHEDDGDQYVQHRHTQQHGFHLHEAHTLLTQSASCVYKQL